MNCLAQAEQGRRHPVTVAGARLGSKPVVVPVLIAINVLTAVQAGSMSNNHLSSTFSAYALWPLLVASGEWWRLLTSGFLHIGVVHLLMNMIALWVIGRDLEMLLGRVRFIAVYVLALLGGSASIFLLGEEAAPVAGASGAVYGLMGGIAVAALRLKVSLRPVLFVIGLNVVLSVTIPGISLLGHLGGLVLGAVATAALVYAPRDRRVLFQAGALGALFLVLLAVLITRDLQFGNVVCVGGGSETRCGVMPG